MKRLMFGATILCLVACLIVACGGGKTITRLDAESTTDLSGRWNDTDSRLVSREMISDCISRPWLTEFAATQGRKP
ncbi:MAG: penicillin-binding protein activator LpoB, partial [candidate division Zixibacteria bacterium]|nr:penicillin-binding protein activator LpoB [candidate division Zixibacteria bacterium]